MNFLTDSLLQLPAFFASTKNGSLRKQRMARRHRNAPRPLRIRSKNYTWTYSKNWKNCTVHSTELFRRIRKIASPIWKKLRPSCFVQVHCYSARSHDTKQILPKRWRQPQMSTSTHLTPHNTYTWALWKKWINCTVQFSALSERFRKSAPLIWKQLRPNCFLQVYS